MAIISLNTNTTGLTGQTVNPRRCTMVTTDTLAAITTAGYLTNQNTAGNPILPTDIFEILYAFNQATNIGTFGIFTVSYSQVTGFTLTEWVNPSNVLLPVVSGDIATFNGTSGQITDSGIASASVQLAANIHAGKATSAGGAAAVAFTIPSALTTSIFVPQIQAQATGTVYIESFVLTTGVATVTFSANPGAVTISYVLFVAPQ